MLSMLLRRVLAAGWPVVDHLGLSDAAARWRPALLTDVLGAEVEGRGGSGSPSPSLSCCNRAASIARICSRSTSSSACSPRWEGRVHVNMFN